MSFLRRLFNFLFNELVGNPNTARPALTYTNRIPTETRNLVWTKFHGNKARGKCYSCGTGINRQNAGWHCSHVIAHSKGGSNNVDNLRTCCRHCNLSMGDQNMYAYIRDKKLNGPGSQRTVSYFLCNPSQIYDKRSNNWKKR